MVRCFRLFDFTNSLFYQKTTTQKIPFMQKETQTFVINWFLNSSDYQFSDFEMDAVISDLEPLFKKTIENYLFLKKINPENIPYLNVNFIEAPQKQV
jgi:hypothetical protein